MLTGHMKIVQNVNVVRSNNADQSQFLNHNDDLVTYPWMPTELNVHKHFRKNKNVHKQKLWNRKQSNHLNAKRQIQKRSMVEYLKSQNHTTFQMATLGDVQYRQVSPHGASMCSLNISNYKPTFYTVTVNHNLGTEISVSFRICSHKQSTVPNFSVHKHISDIAYSLEAHGQRNCEC